MDKVTELKDRIIRMIYEDNKCTAHFEFYTPIGKYIQNKPAMTLTLSTYNIRHGQSFVLGRFNGITEEECLEHALDLITKPAVNSYTVQWVSKDKPTESILSYFTGSSMLSALDKFYHGREEKDFVVYTCKLNPIE